MDMELLSRMVGELILDHDHVGLPGVGTFVAEMVPATFSDRGYTINPPYRRLSFSNDILEEDLLVDFYAAENSIGIPAARAYLTAFLAEMKGVLKSRKAVTFPGLGRLRATRRDAFFFVPVEDLDIYPEGFGLESLSLKTHVETDEEVSIAVSDLASILEAARQEAVPAPAPVTEDIQDAPHKKRRGWIWPVAVIGAATLLLIVFLVLARVAPGFIDSILYTEEELRIINA